MCSAKKEKKDQRQRKKHGKMKEHNIYSAKLLRKTVKGKGEYSRREEGTYPVTTGYKRRKRKKERKRAGLRRTLTPDDGERLFAGRFYGRLGHKD